MANKLYNKSKSEEIEKRPDSDAPFSETVQRRLIANMENEYSAAKNNLSDLFEEGEEYYDMIHCEREQTLYDDDPNIYLPEYLSRLLAEQGTFCAQHFGSRDFVDTYQESDDPQDVAESKASKKLLNILLNDPKAHYYHKINRLKMAISPKGYGIIKGGYRQVIEQQFQGYDERVEYVTDDDGYYLDSDGEPVIDTAIQEPLTETVRTPIYEDVVVEDRPVFDVYPNEDVLFSPEYTYSLQDKRYVFFLGRKTLDEIEAEAEQMGYFNLEILRQKAKTNTGEPDQRIEKNEEPVFQPSPVFELKERWGVYPVVVERDEETDEITDYEPGIDSDGRMKDGAENLELIITTASFGAGKDGIQEIIRFQISPFSQRPMVRFLCYVDEKRDTGFGDGEGAIELQTAQNDNFNLGMIRTMLATKPSFKAKKWMGIPADVRVFSEKTIELENLGDLEELKITDDITGSINQDARLGNAMDRLTAYSPLSMGGATDNRETATVGSIMDQRASIRQGLKNLNLEFIGFAEFYNMLLSLCNDFMLEETLFELLGDLAPFYNPDRKDRFKPVTQAIESEHSKGTKLKMWQNLMQIVGSVPNPNTPSVLNYMMGQILEIVGGDFKVFKRFMFEEDPQAIMLWHQIMGIGSGKQAMQPPSAPAPQGQPTQNQRGMPQQPQEQQTREAMMQ
jgi:hypothetical protein